jgi:uncharacterized SAM-binding protein YcdF (DUF218 family)
MKLARRRRWAPILGLVLLAAAAIVGVPSIRETVLRAAGWALVVNEPIAPSDVIVVTLDSGGAGALEAADLVHSGIATRVAVFTDPPSEEEDYEFIRRGLPYEDGSARQIRQMRWLGVTDIVQIPRTEDGTEGEAWVLPPWCDQHQLRSIVFVTARDHSRRVRLVLDRVMKGHLTRVTVQPARYSNFDPNRWWATRDGIRTEIVEFQKLVLEVVLHPISFFTSFKRMPPNGNAYTSLARPRGRIETVAARAPTRGKGEARSVIARRPCDDRRKNPC